MKIVTDKKVYQCEHCGKVSLGAGAMSRHERVCHENPKNKPQCWEFCKHFSESDEKQEVWKNDWCSSRVRKRKCEARNCFLLTPLCSEWKKEELRNIDDADWQQMPSIVEGCEHFCNPDDDKPFPWEAPGL